MKHEFDLTVTTDTIIHQDRLLEWVRHALDLGADECPEDERRFLQAADIVLVSKPAPTTQLAAKARRFVQALDDMGFGADEPINGGDCVEFIDQNQVLLRRLPALCELADAVDRFLRAKVPEDGSYAQIIEPLFTAHQRLKGA